MLALNIAGWSVALAACAWQEGRYYRDRRRRDPRMRFLAPPPVVIPPDATEKERLELGFPAVPPPAGSHKRERWDALGCRLKRDRRPG